MVKAVIYQSPKGILRSAVAEVEIPVVPRTGDYFVLDMDGKAIEGDIREIGWHFRPGTLEKVSIFLNE